MFPFEGARLFQMYFLEIDADGYPSTEAHQSGTQKFITIFSGSLTISIGGEDFVINFLC